ncbi:thiopurine S-methyltransferase [Haliea sp. E17]|uniref:thiopurine S-methyltransferase n=1 Tax=Haliea sp. E17 TaxID=3401576 RepID=UPI003AAB714D
MEPGYWNAKWSSGELGFHLDAPNPLLLRLFPQVAPPPGARVLVPLCGKSLDIAWLLGAGYRVVAVELVESAVQQLFAALAIDPEIDDSAALRCYRAQGLDIFVGDIFELTPAATGAVDFVYDRAALVALPEPLRSRYTGHLPALSAGAPQLLVTLVYDQAAMPGPPFSIDEQVLRQHYGERYSLALLDDQVVEGGLKGKCPAREQVWHVVHV